jgi:hypothetical protein
VTFVHHFEIHWAKRVINVEDEEKKKLNMDAALFRHDTSTKIKPR